MTVWWWMLAAVVTQWACVVALRASNGLRRPVWSVTTFVAMLASLACVSKALSSGLTVAVAYGIWTGAGVALAALSGAVLFADRLDARQTFGLVLVLVGVIVLQVA